MALAFIRGNCLFKKQATRRMGSTQSSPTESCQTRRKSSQVSGPCDVIAIVQSRKRDMFHELIRALVYGDGRVRATGEHGMTALHYAVLNGDESAIKVLIVFGADCNALNDFKQTPLDMAVENRKEDVIPLLVSIGCKSGSVISRTSSCSSCYESSSATSSPEQLNSPFDLPLNELSPVLEGLKRSKAVLADELELHLRSQLDLSSSIRPDDAYAYVLQQKELIKFREDTDSSDRSNTPLQRGVTPPPVEFASRGGVKILSMDGGGMRGLIQLEILAEIERLTGKRIVELFDWIIGNSIGGIMALGLVYADMSLEQLRKFYFRIKDDVFGKKTISGYNTKLFERILQEELGSRAMNECRHPRVLVTAVDKSNTPMSIHYFNNCFDDEFCTQPIWKVARYTSAAPLYFAELDNYVDGGVMANNPCDGGLAKIQSFYQAQQLRARIGCMVSLGSGVFPPNPLGQVSIFGGMGNLLRLLSDALGQSEAIADRCKASCEAQSIPFYRFSPPLEKSVEPTETKSQKLVDIMVTARIYMHSDDYKLDRLLPLLLTPTTQSPRISR